MWPIHADNTSCGLCPMTDLTGSDYTADSTTEPMGLYTLPGGTKTNVPPPDHFEQLILTCLGIKQNPINGSVCGAVVGMSNVQIWGTQLVADFNAAKSAMVFGSEVDLYNFADSGGTFEGIINPASNYRTTTLPALISASGHDAEDFQYLIWGEACDTYGNKFGVEGDPGNNPRGIPTSFADIPGYWADKIKDCIDVFKSIFPNLKVVFINSRSYSGYGGIYGVDTGWISKSPEVLTYRSGFGVRKAIVNQINQESGWEYDTFPLVAWAPYIWGDGETASPGATDNNKCVFSITSPASAFDCEGQGASGIHPLGDGEDGLEVQVSQAILTWMQFYWGARLIFQP